MKYGYARVSTRGQASKGNSLDDQRQQLVSAGADEVIEEQYTGTTMKRPAFDTLLKELKAGDTLMVTKLDRFARSAATGSQLIESLLHRGVRVNILNMGEVSDTPQGKLMLQILLAFAEFERDMIVERTQAGKAIARTKAGFREGRPPISAKRKENAAHLILDVHHSYKEVEAETGLSRSTIIRAVRARRKREAEQQEGLSD